MDTKWYPTRAGEKFAGVAQGGVILEPVLAVRRGASLRVSGSFGVFFPGRVMARFLDASGSELGSLPLGNSEPAEILNLNQEVQAPRGTSRVRVSIEGGQGENGGVLGEAAVPGNF